MGRMKKIALGALAVATALCLAGCGSSGSSTEPKEADAQSAPVEQKASEAEKPAEEAAPKAEEAPTPEAAAPSETASQKNAVRKAKDYLDYTAFSYTGLIEQLEYEKFSTDDATYGPDNSGADWDEQAAKKAADYLDYSSFSRDGLIEQLEYEGFTPDQATYGVDTVGL